MERIYQRIIHKFREEQSENEIKVHVLNKRSMELDNHISALREENLVRMALCTVLACVLTHVLVCTCREI